MRTAAAQIRLHVRADFIIARVGIFLQQRLRAHDHSSNAVTTLRRLLVNESLLNCAGLFCAAKTLDRHHLAAGERCDRQQTRKHRTAIYHHGACSTLAHTAAELGGIEP